MTIYLAMTQPQLALLRAGGEIRLSTTDGSLAPPLADAVRQAAAEQVQRDAERMAQRLQVGAADRGASPPAAAPPADSPMGGEASASIRFSTTGFRKGPPRPGGPPLQLRFTLTNDPESGNRRRMFPVTWWPMLRPGADAATAATEPRDPALQREVALTFPGLKPPAVTADPGPGGRQSSSGRPTCRPWATCARRCTGRRGWR